MREYRWDCTELTVWSLGAATDGPSMLREADAKLGGRGGRGWVSSRYGNVGP